MFAGLKRLWHKLGSPRWFFTMSSSWVTFFGFAALVLLCTGSIWALAIAPEDYQQGNSYRIMYVHVPAAIVSQSAYMLMGAAGLVLLVWRMKLADMVLACVVPFGLSMTALALLTGAIWGKPTWGAWWVWDARTVSMLVLLFLYFGLYALRQAIPRAEAAGRACAILAIVGLVNIPIIKYSVDWWLTLHQPSSNLLTNPTMPGSMYIPLMINILGTYCLFAYVLLSRLQVEILRREEGTSWVQTYLTDRTVTADAAA